ncbi:hypothetical protein H6F88_17960 [Oculatella sp. FACHB-28]|uniref:hypothetical protein n=1 Tax=Oculatella sp. FACHB-28 TaxID=2692845 RepID=UPI001687FF21|nr:hypothetical protein [Oculatella sp. FACHB-28]MBD2057882.1 hypothetical protein [Oculatella sp. FACHB-28]
MSQINLQQAVELLQTAISEELVNLEREEAQLAKLQARIARKQANVKHLQGTLDFLLSKDGEQLVQINSSVSSEFDTDKSEEVALRRESTSSEDGETPEHTSQNLDKQNFKLEIQKKRMPMDMLRPQYKQPNLRLGDIVERVLSQSAKSMTTEELTRAIYDTRSVEEFSRARNSLSVELRSGAVGETPRWIKLDRRTYASRSLHRSKQLFEASAVPVSLCLEPKNRSSVIHPIDWALR